MKRILLIIGFVASLAAMQAQSDLYRRYAQHTGVRVAEVDGFRIDSATAVDVLMIEAMSDSGWTWLRTDLAIIEPTPEQQLDLLDGRDVVLFEQRDRHNPARPAPVEGERVDNSSGCYLGISFLGRTVFIFSPQTDAQAQAVVSCLVQKMLHRSEQQ